MRYVQTSTLGQNLAPRLAVLAMLLAGLAAAPAGAQQTSDTSSEVPPQPPASSPVLPPPRANQYSSNEIIDAGHHFFGGISHGLASIVEKAVSQWGLRMAIFWEKKRAAPSSAVCGTAKGRSIRGMPVMCVCSGRGPRLASIMAPTVRTP
jgi:hypothetical protein